MIVDALSGLVLAWNDAMERMLGWTARDAVGRTFEVVVPERHRAAHQAGLAAYGTSGVRRGSAQIADLPAVHASGREVVNRLRLTIAESAGVPYAIGTLVEVEARALPA